MRALCTFILPLYPVRKPLYLAHCLMLKRLHLIKPHALVGKKYWRKTARCHEQFCYFLLSSIHFYLPNLLKDIWIFWKVYAYTWVLSCFSHVQLFATLWTVVQQAPLSMGFSMQEYSNGLSCPPLGALPDPRIPNLHLMSPALAGGFLTTSASWEILSWLQIHLFMV